MHFAVTLCIIFTVFVKIFEGASICKVPNGDAGTCEEISKCKPLWEVHQKRHKSKEEHQYMGQAYCGNPSSNKIKVCCPDKSIWPIFEINPVKYGNPDIDIQPEPPLINLVVGNQLSKPLPLSTDVDNRIVGAGDNQKGCDAYSSSSNKITGGEPTAIDQYPWLVLLEYAGELFGCGGSLITARFVLTAAHCLDGINGIPKIAHLAEYNITSYPTDFVEVEGGGIDQIDNILIPIESGTKHPDFTRKTYQHDIGLVKLAQTVVLSDFIKLACLPTRDYIPEFSKNTNFTVAGWGDDPNKLEFYDVKKEVTIPYVSLSKCRTIHSKTVLIDSQICAGGEAGKDTCKGDSGGPLMYESNQLFIVVGVVSNGPRDCGTKGQPAVYTDVFKYINWINGVILGRV